MNKKNIITDYISNNGITKKDILSYTDFFPDKVMRNLIENEAVFNVIQ